MASNGDIGASTYIPNFLVGAGFFDRDFIDESIASYSLFDMKCRNALRRWLE